MKIRKYQRNVKAKRIAYGESSSARRRNGGGSNVVSQDGHQRIGINGGISGERTSHQRRNRNIVEAS